MPQHVPTYATTFGRAFVDALSSHPELGGAMQAVAKEYSGERIAIGDAHEALELLIRLTRDEDLGLKAARCLRIGDAGPVDYLLRSAATVRRAIDSACVYARLMNEVLDIELVVASEMALLRFDNAVVLPRAALDFQVGGMFRTHVRHWFGDRLTGLTVCFPHEAPDDLSEYRETFEGAAMAFGRPALGFAFDARYLELPLEQADPHLEELLSRQAERALGALRAKGLGADVRRAVAQTLARRRASLVRVASRFGISPSTLARRLGEEGTSFREILDAVRAEVARQYLRQSPLDLADIAKRVGFSDSAAFGRAFRRWTGQTPGQYRRRTELM
jgi:AraC-like DNA-binding protein